MKNTTISIGQDLLEKAKSAANASSISLSSYIKQLIEKSINYNQLSVAEDLLSLSKRFEGKLKGKKWTRDEINDRR